MSQLCTTNFETEGVQILGGLVWPSGFQWYDMIQCRPVFAFGSSTAGTVSFLEEAEFNEVMMVPSSDQLTVGKVWPALQPGWTSIILCMAGGPGWSTSHMSVNESILSDIVDEQWIFIVYFWWKLLSPLLWRKRVKHDSPVNLACAPLPPSSCNTIVLTIVLTIRLAIRLQLFLTFSLSISSQMFF